MKKILLATTLLAASAGFASAEVALSGKGRMGVVYDGNDAVFSSRIRIYFTASGETDSGLSFGAEVRNDQSGVNQQNNDDSTVYISGAFGKVTMGDTGNASDSILGQVSAVGYTSLGSTNEIGFVGRDFTGAMYEYSTGALTFALGAGQTIDTDLAAGTDDFVSAAVKYSVDQYSVGLAYEDNASMNQVTLMGTANFGAAAVKLKLVDRSLDVGVDPDMAAALSVDYTAGATVITAFATDNYDFAGTDTYGLGVSYDLGGGATVMGGVVDNGVDTVADLGLVMAF